MTDSIWEPLPLQLSIDCPRVNSQVIFFAGESCLVLLQFFVNIGGTAEPLSTITLQTLLVVMPPPFYLLPQRVSYSLSFQMARTPSPT